MPYPHLDLQCADARVDTTIRMFTEPSLREAHNLLMISFDDGGMPGHFGRAAAVMTLVTIAATSAVRYMDLGKNKPSRLDSEIFAECLVAFFPWDDIGITDSEYIATHSRRPPDELRGVAAETLYRALRNPLLHSGGAVSKRLSTKSNKRFPRVSIQHPFPGLSPQENDQYLCDWCRLPTLKGQEVMSFDEFEVKLVTRPLYWATRRMIEAFAADPLVQADVARAHGIT